MKNILNFCKYAFIPCQENGYRPRFLASSALLFLAIAAVFIEAVFILPIGFNNRSGGDQLAAVYSNAILDLTNESRSANHTLTLRESPLLNQAATLKAQDMATRNYFEHTSPDGLTPWYWLDQVGYKYSYAGENLAVNFADSKDIVLAWLNSPTHRANLLNSNFTEIGIGIAFGHYDGRDGYFVVQEFARPANVSIGPSTQQIALRGLSMSDFPFLQADYWKGLWASPRQSVESFLLVLIVFLILALALKVLVKIKIQSLDIILNTLLIILFLVIILIVNKYAFTGLSFVK